MGRVQSFRLRESGGAASIFGAAGTSPRYSILVLGEPEHNLRRHDRPPLLDDSGVRVNDGLVRFRLVLLPFGDGDAFIPCWIGNLEHALSEKVEIIRNIEKRSRPTCYVGVV